MSAPACTRRIVRCPVRELHAGEGYVRGVRLDHMRESMGALICAEGEEEAATLPATTTDIWCVDDRILAYRQAREQVTVLSNNRIYAVSDEIVRIVKNIDQNGNDVITALGKDALYIFQNFSASAIRINAPVPTTTNVVTLHERLFGARDLQIRYTPALNFQGWTEYGEQTAGTCDLLPTCGNVVDIVAMRGHVYFLREFGITRLTGYVDVYNFRLDDLPFGMGRVLSYAAVIGESAYFFTDAGLCRFDGNSAERAQGADDGEIDLTQPIRVERAWGTALAASVTLTDGTAALYVYEPVLRRGRFVRHAFEKFAAANALVIMREGKAYRLTGCALPAGGSCSVTAEFALSGLGEGEKKLEAVYVAGTGNVLAEAFGPDGVCRRCSGSAGEWLDFAAGVRGESVTVRISSQDEDISVREIALRIRREDRL